MPQPQMTEEQIKALQEKLKNMSPEELKEFQKKQCIFCQIISGKVASKKIYEDDKCIAILDINPANPGHVLLLPKEHYAIMPMIPEDELGHLSMVAKALSHIMLNTLKAEGTTIFIANGIAAGQRAQHFMMHIIPRKQGDNVLLNIPEKKLSKKEIISIKKAIQEKVESLFNLKKSTVEVEKKPGTQSDSSLTHAKSDSSLIKEAEFKDIEEKSSKKKKLSKEKIKPKKLKKPKQKKKSISLDDIAGLFK